MIMNTPKTKSSPKPGVSLRIAEQEPAPPHSFTGSAEAGGSDALLQLGELQQQEAARVLLQPELVHPDGIDSCRARIPAEIVENIVSMAVQMARVRWRDVHAELLYHTRASSSSPFIFFFFSSNFCTFCGYVHF